MAKLIDPFIGVDHAWMSGIGCSFPPHKYADVKRRLPRVASQSHPSIRSRCAWRWCGGEAVFEFEGDEGTHVLPAIEMIRDDGEELPASAASWCRMNCPRASKRSKIRKSLR